MHDFHYVGNQLYCEQVPLERLAREYGTPIYVYSQHTLTDHFQKLDCALAGLDHLICYAVKSNSSLSVLRTLARLDSGFDIVSGGELQRVQAAGGRAAKCVFAGVGKTTEEIELALRAGVYAFNAESEPELERIEEIASRLRKAAPVSLRVNPNIEAHTHKKITTGTYENKFGIAFEKIEAVYARAARLKHLRLRGLQMHIGSQITDTAPFEQAVRKVTPLVQRLKERFGLEFLSIGGGLGIVYEPALASGSDRWWQTPDARRILTPRSYAARLLPLLHPLGLRILLEPGRFISGNAGVLITRVEYVKKTGRKNFLIVDAAMNDLIRPAFYDAYHEIIPLRRGRNGATLKSDVVGPICESGDFFCQDRALPRLGQGEYLALMSAGAYGSVMASNYNTRPLATEALVNGRRAAVVRQRQPVQDIWRGEQLAPWQK
ncbi:MAG TPA: diaminopimelate decarboxylase [Verrucomicrobiae bacterium]|nr:diaminopimelate decarboxylase [Verrucomicrobiae bacterium]